MSTPATTDNAAPANAAPTGGANGVASLFQRAMFRYRIRGGVAASFRKAYLTMLGARFGPGTNVPPLVMNWPHQVQIGRNCALEEGTAFIVADSWRPGPSILVGDNVFIGRHCEFNVCDKLIIGDDALIASGCKFIDHDHSIAPGNSINVQPLVIAPIRVEADAWLGVNVVVLKGVTIGRGAVIGAGAVVTKSVPAGEIWAGVPAAKIGERRSPHPPLPSPSSYILCEGRGEPEQTRRLSLPCIHSPSLLLRGEGGRG